MAKIIDIFTKQVLAIDPDDDIHAKPYSKVKAVIEAAFGAGLPKHFKRSMSRPQDRPYKFGDCHNVTYRKRTRLFNSPMPVACEVTPESCLKIDEVYILGSECLVGIDEPFPWVDRKYNVSLNFLKSLPNGARIRITTRSDLIACQDYIDELKRLDAFVSILVPISVSDDDVRQIEPGAPSRARRIEAVKVLEENGIGVEIRRHAIPVKNSKKSA